MLIYTQACGVVVLSVLLVLFLVKRSKIFINTEKLFIATLVTSLLANIMDITCQFLLADSAVPYAITKFCCELYQILILAVLCFTMMYVSRDIYQNTKRFIVRSWYYVAIFIASAVAVFVLPEELSTESGKLYAYGTSVTVSYLIGMFYIGAVLVRVNILHKSINADRRIAINLWMFLWIIVAILEYIFPSVFMSGFATSIGVMIVYVKLENPGMNMDRTSGLYNQNALMEYLHQMFGSHKKFSMMIVVPLNYGDGLYNEELDLKRVPHIFGLKKTPIFRKTEDELAIVFDRVGAAKEWGRDYAKREGNSKDKDIVTLKNALWINVGNSEWFQDVEELMYFIKYVIADKYDKLDSNERNFIDVDEKMINRMRDEKRVEKMLDRALMENHVEVFYQPIFSTEKNRFSSAEALVRIRDSKGKIIPPGVFISIAEKSGKIIELGREVFTQVCRLIKEDNIMQYGIDYIEVNLSVAQCTDSTLADSYIATMKEFEVDPKCINLEITESASLKNKEILLDNMNRLIEYGVNFSLDDFGTGQSNLNYIVDMPVDIVKFDRGMINAYFANDKAKYVMDAAMHMIQGMGLKIVSEGIETDEQFDKMNDLGISYVQGFYFSKPLEKNEFIQYVKEHNQGAKDV